MLIASTLYRLFQKRINPQPGSPHGLPDPKEDKMDRQEMIDKIREFKATHPDVPHKEMTIDQWADLILPLIKNGMTLSCIAKQHGVSPAWISKVKTHLQSLGRLPPDPKVEQKPGRPLSDREEYVLRNVGRYGLRPSEFAHSMGISKSRVSDIIRNLKAMRYLTPYHGACGITKKGDRELALFSEFGSYHNLKKRGFKNG